MKPEEIKQQLEHFTGSENITKWSMLSRLNLTDGALFVAKECNAYWLMDIIASYQHRLKEYPFQVWKLIVKDSKGVVRCEDGDDTEVITQKIPFTDFPLDEITLWCTNELIMLPSEY